MTKAKPRSGPIRYKGKVTGWKDDQGFGFVTPNGGGPKVFLHISALSTRGRRPVENDVVTYEMTFDQKKRARATNVQFLRNVRVPPRQGNSFDAVSLAIPALFLIFVAAVVLAGRLPTIILAIYAGTSIAAFLAYALDKSAARNNRWRTSENTLHLISLAGGWPAAWIAQKVLHHKSRKAGFQRVYWATIILNCAALVWLLTPHGRNAVRLIVG